MASEPDSRDDKGRFKPGQTGNPGGRARMPEEVRELLRAASPKAAKALVDALDAERAVVVGTGADAALEMVPDHDMRVKAATALFDRLYGKPTQMVADEDGGPIRLGLIVLPSEQASGE